MRVIPDAVKRIWNIYFLRAATPILPTAASTNCVPPGSSAVANQAATVSPIPSGSGSGKPTQKPCA